MVEGRVDLTRWWEIMYAGAKNDPHPTYGQTALQVRGSKITPLMHTASLRSAFSHLY